MSYIHRALLEEASSLLRYYKHLLISFITRMCDFYLLKKEREEGPDSGDVARKVVKVQAVQGVTLQLD